MTIIRRLACAAAIALVASAAHAELDGPVSVVDKTSCTTTGSPPVTTCTPVPGIHEITSAGFYAAHADVLAQYRDASQADLQDVYAGDDPHAPATTVALTFPDQATADAVKAQLIPTS